MQAPPRQDKLTRQQYESWKRLVPYLYDWYVDCVQRRLQGGNLPHSLPHSVSFRFENHALVWPSLSIQWGPVLSAEEEVQFGVANNQAHNKKARYMDDPSGAKGTSFSYSAENKVVTSDIRSLYLTEQTDGSAVNTLCLACVDVPQQWASGPINLATMGASQLHQTKNSNVRVLKTIVHPGEVNRVTTVPNFRHVVATHTDSPEVYVWNFNTQENRDSDMGKKKVVEASTPDAVLVGHRENAEFAMGACDVKALLASGGKDTQVLVWDIEGALGKGKLPPSVILEGHTNTVEDVCFKPENQHELVSVADDYSMLFWDTRTSTKAVDRVTNAHGSNDLHSVDWSLVTPYLLVTGAQDGGVYVWDKRNLGMGPTHKFMHHHKAVTKVEWSPHVHSVLASGSDDGIVAVWDLNRRASENRTALNMAVPEELIIQHAGHTSSVVDFCWNPDDPWTLMSASVNSAGNGPMPISGGGALQFWRVSEIVRRCFLSFCSFSRSSFCFGFRSGCFGTRSLGRLGVVAVVDAGVQDGRRLDEGSPGLQGLHRVRGRESGTYRRFIAGALVALTRRLAASLTHTFLVVVVWQLPGGPPLKA